MARVTKIPSAPQNVAFMITRHCNLHCVHCSASPEQFLREDMTTKEILGVIDDLARCKVFRVTMTGGEPLTHPDFFAIVDAFVEKPMHLQINTNGTLITEQIIRRLAKLRRRPRVLVSLDGVTAETYDRIRGPGRFEDMRKGIRMLRKADFDVRPFVVVSRLNYHELPRIAEFANSIGTGSIKVVDPQVCGRVPLHMDEMAIPPEELPRLLDMVLEIDRHHPGLLNGAWLQTAHFYRKLKDGTIGEPDPGERLFFNCGAAWGQAAIACDGTVSPCEMAFTYRAGNVLDQPFDQIWRESPVFDAIRQCRGMPLAKVHGCEDCSWHHTCSGPCPISGYTAYGVWPAVGPVCLMRQVGTLFENGTIVQDKRKASSWNSKSAASPC